MKALVLGGSKFIGLHLVRALLEAGHDVTVLNRGVTPVTFSAPVARLTADRSDAASVRKALRRSTWDAVFDISGYTASQVAPVVEALQGGVDRYVFCSTVSVYGHCDFAPIAEDFPLDRRPDALPYAAGKVQAEDLLMEAYRKHRFPVTVIRPSMVYGPHNPLVERELSVFVRLLLGGKVLIPGSGETLRHFGHVEDLAQAFLLAAASDHALGQAYNITGPDVVTINDYVRTIARVMNARAVLVHLSEGEANQVDVRRFFPYLWRASLVYSTRKAERELRFQPRYHFEEGHRQTYQWYRAQGLLEQAKTMFDFSYEDEVLRRFGR